MPAADAGILDGPGRPMSPVDVDATVAVMEAAFAPKPTSPGFVWMSLSASTIAVTSSIRGAGVGVVVVAVVVTFVCAAVVAIRLARWRRRWSKIARFDVAEFAVASVWAARSEAPGRFSSSASARFAMLRDPVFAAAGPLVDRFVRSVCLNLPRHQQTGFALSRPPLSPMMMVRRLSRVDLETAGIVVGCEYLLVLCVSCAPTVPRTNVADMAAVIVDAAQGVDADVLEVAAGLAAHRPQQLHVFEALELAELVLARPA